MAKRSLTPSKLLSGRLLFLRATLLFFTFFSFKAVALLFVGLLPSSGGELAMQLHLPFFGGLFPSYLSYQLNLHISVDLISIPVGERTKGRLILIVQQWFKTRRKRFRRKKQSAGFKCGLLFGASNTQGARVFLSRKVLYKTGFIF